MTAAGRRALLLVLVWAAGAAAWNIEGVRRLAAGQQALGPTASLAGAAIIAALAIAILVGSRQSRWLLELSCAIVVVLTGIALWSAFTGSADQWPSAGWRWSGVMLNGMGFSAALTLAISARGVSGREHR